MHLDHGAEVMIREADADDLAWANERYADLGFDPSDPAIARTYVAWHGGERVGLGRLVRLSDGSLELGGMHVVPGWRGTGIARSILGRLLSIAEDEPVVWCVPFQQLGHFYQSHGFEEVESVEGIPAELIDKVKRCREHFEDGVKVLRRVRQH